MSIPTPNDCVVALLDTINTKCAKAAQKEVNYEELYNYCKWNSL